MSNQIKTNNQSRIHYINSEDDIADFTSAMCVISQDLFMNDILLKGFDLKTEKWKSNRYREICIKYLQDALKKPLVGRNSCGSDMILDYLHEQYPNEF